MAVQIKKRLLGQRTNSPEPVQSFGPVGSLFLLGVLME